MARAKKQTASVASAIMAFKGFGLDWKCRNHQFEVGKSYKHEGRVKACEGGFHACEYPLDVFNYYPPATSRFAIVEMNGESDKHSADTKIAAAEITIKAEIRIPEIVAAAVKYVFDRAKWSDDTTATGYQGAASATGYQGAASATGYQGAASATGDYGAASATGYQGAASATGDYGAASATGYQGAVSATGTRGAASATGTRGAASATGDYGAASATGTRGAASATGTRGAASATGDYGAASATDYQGAASATGYQGAASATGTRGAASATGKYSSALAAGIEAKAKASEGCALHLEERIDNWGADDHGKIVAVWSGIAGRDGIKPDTFYLLRDGKPIETAD